MSTFLHYKFNKNIKYYIQLQTNTSILIGLSGGQDSLCMVKILMDIKKLYHLDIGIINIDHQWRDDNVSNTHQIINIIKTFNVNTYIYELSPRYYTEEEARNIRYQICLNTAHNNNYSCIATAHSFNDQIETGIHHIFRGSCIDNLTSLTWKRKYDNVINIIRPMLNIQRWEIHWFCRNFSLPIWHDISNLLCDKERNRIRQELVPYIQYHFSYAIEKQIGNFISHALVDSEYIRQNTLKLYLVIRHPNLIAIDMVKLMHQHLALRNRLIYLFLIHNLHINLPNRLLTDIINRIEKRIAIKIIYGPIIIYKNKNWLYLCSREPISYDN